MFSVNDYDYYLPPELIADSALINRTSSRLLRIDRRTGETSHHNFYEITNFLRAGDVLVLNNTKVFKARLFAKPVNRNYDKLEVILLNNLDEYRWEILLRRMRKMRIGQLFVFENNFTAILESKDEIKGTAIIKFNKTVSEILALTDEFGEIPLPTYIESPKNISLEDYQTTFASIVGSVAAPTAGRHFTPDLLKAISEKGVIIEYITLHVGLGTFQPIRTDDIREHEMHSETVIVSAETARRIRLAKLEKRRVVAVGTTVVRTLEGIFNLQGELPNNGYTGEINLYINPGFEFKVIDALVTNFHLPKTTLLVLVSTFAGRELILKAYNEAIENRYRFYSLGDAMFIE
jgi:S-adenosylmethionine:tRNA ribosyltransferase-isomerase